MEKTGTPFVKRPGAGMEDETKRRNEGKTDKNLQQWLADGGSLILGTCMCSLVHADRRPMHNREQISAEGQTNRWISD